jgi:3-mercaptopropionate dioxygenase
MDNVLTDFIDTYVDKARACESAADCVEALAPLMLELLDQTDSFLTDAHRRSDPISYCRNLIHSSDDESVSLYALVWLPGQWTPVHDHGSWGVVGVVEGVLEERNFARIDDHHDRDEGIELVRSGVILLTAGAVTTFVPNPDHIHLTGVHAARAPVVSLHLYGRQMDDFHIYDVEAGSRRLVNVAHNKS